MFKENKFEIKDEVRTQQVTLEHRLEGAVQMLEKAPSLQKEWQMGRPDEE